MRVRGARRTAIGKRLTSFLHWVRVRVGISEDASLRLRLAKAGHRGNAPVDLYHAARVITPVLVLLAASFIPYQPAVCHARLARNCTICCPTSCCSA